MPIFVTIDRSNEPSPIFRSPVHIRRSRLPYFEPKFVSIGPYFHGDEREHLVPMEQLKPKFISEFLLALGISQPVDPVPVDPLRPQPVDPVPVDPFMELVGDVRGCYEEKVVYSDDAFLEILVRDSFFIIGIILLFQEEVSMTFKEGSSLVDMNVKGIRSDLLLLENQIPLFFVKKVWDWISDRMVMEVEGPKVYFETIVEPFIGFDMQWKFNENHMEGAAHLLDLYWRCSVPPGIMAQIPKFPQIEPSPRLWKERYKLVCDSEVIPNATKLTKVAGIKFKKHCEGLHVFFRHGKGSMHMPCLIIDSNQTTILANLIAFETSKSSSTRIFHDYIKLMVDLVDSENDVELLQGCGVIYNKLSSHKLAATFFNDIGNCLVDTNHNYFSDLYAVVQIYYRSNRPYQWWARISVGAGSILLIMSAVQTFYTVYAYYRPQH